MDVRSRYILSDFSYSCGGFFCIQYSKVCLLIIINHNYIYCSIVIIELSKLLFSIQAISVLLFRFIFSFIKN